MKFAKFVVAMLGLVVLGGFIIGGCACRGYNQAVTLDESVKSSWAQVENVLQRRFDLVPNLVETVKGVAGQETDLFKGIAEARSGYMSAKSPAEKAKAAGMFESALSRQINVVVERYPEMKSNESFLKLQDTLEGTENRLAVERRNYNEAVKKLNVFRRRLLGSIYASLAGVEEGEYFEIEDAARENPKVDFTSDKDDGPNG